ncbi:HNH endonuclease [Burkholderia pseudomallei]|uniref:HNH endonuclease n=1 Tax=Burkholderia pseudomallei TaxID=28450 RepID=UPI000A1A1DF5|nr:HNH endonuclease [Burkholderia pseudomallei]ARL87612.1 HNH endonuclease [Burkholderia pseudomallei]ARL95600.1 HNH endonuclease [Burkholderia pseudomallei]
MPKRAPTQCRHYGCGRLVAVPGYCAEHASEAVGWQSDRLRGSRHARGYGTAWTKLRREVLARDNGLCVPCRKKGRIARAVAVDHIVSKAEGGTDEHANLQSICKPCHDAKTATEAARGRGRR